MVDKQSYQMKWILFFVFLVLFVLSVLGTFGIVFFGFGTPTIDERELLVKVLIGEIAAAVIVLFYSMFNLKKQGNAPTQSNEDQNSAKLQNSFIELENLRTQNSDQKQRIKELEKQIETYSSTRTKVLGIFGRNKEFTVSDTAREIYYEGYDSKDRLVILDVIGNLINEGLVEGCPHYTDKYQMVRKY